MRRWIGIAAALLVSLLLMAGAPAMAKQNVMVEIFYNGVWNNHTLDLYSRNPITINRAAGSEQTGVVPTDGTLTFQTRDGRLNPDNVKSPLYGLIGEKTPIRVKVNGDIRLSGRAVKWSPRRSLGGQKFDAWVNVTVAGKVRELGQGEAPVRSALERTIKHEAVTTPLLAYWSFEELTAADQFGSGVAGGSPMRVPANVLTSNDDTLPGSKPLPTFTHNVPDQGRGPIKVVTLAGTTLTWDMWVKTPLAGEYFDANLYTEGGHHWHVTVDNVGRVDLFYYNTTSGIDVIVTNAGLMQGQWHNLRFVMIQSGGNVDASLYFDGVLNADGLGSGPTTGTITAPNLATLEAAYTATESEKNNIGHMTVWDGIPSINFTTAGRGYLAEKAGDRFNRISAEEGISATIVGSAIETQPMGAQYPDTTLQLLDEIARTDVGIIFDTRTEEGLTFRTGRSLYNQ